ncbi:MDR family MFS transporter [Actinoplanes sp. NPDC049118]|uniref:MDR family MFS transporter n=1 Tax=Actinoplanes sp. NPDC049118 TaxID=3155769 RepID=UPI0033E80331
MATATTARLPAVSAPGQDAGGREDWHRAVMAVLPGLLAAIFLAALDQTVMSASIKTIADDLGGLSLQAWVTTAFLITSTVTTPLYGKLSDVYGRRPMFAVAISIFVAGSLACTFAQTMYQLAAFRGLQGLGAGGLLAVSSAITADLVPPLQRSRFQGYTMTAWLAASLVGPLAGGLFAANDAILGMAGWRWIFLVNVPVGALAMVIVLRVLRTDAVRRAHRVDYWGATMITAAAVPLLLVAEQGHERGWTSPAALLCYAVGGLGIVAFLWFERRMGDDALIPLRLFGSPTFSLAVLISALVGAGMFGVISTVPLYLQVVQGFSPTRAGLMLLPMMGGTLITMIFSGKVVKRGGALRALPAGGAAVTALALLACYRLTVDTPVWVLVVIMIAFGFGIGTSRSLNVTAQNAVPKWDLGVATSSVMFFRETAGAVGVAAYLSVLFAALPGALSASVARAAARPDVASALADPAVRDDPHNAPFLTVLRGGREALADSSFLPLMDERLARAFQIGFDDAVGRVFAVGAGLMCLAAVLALCMRPPQLREPDPDPEPVTEYFGRHRAPVPAGTT